MSGRVNPPPKEQLPATGPSDKGKEKVKIRKGKKWVEVEGDVVQKGRFKYVEFTDDDGLDTWWIVPPQ
jgi:hypothetical protein